MIECEFSFYKMRRRKNYKIRTNKLILIYSFVFFKLKKSNWQDSPITHHLRRFFLVLHLFRVWQIIVTQIFFWKMRRRKNYKIRANKLVLIYSFVFFKLKKSNYQDSPITHHLRRFFLVLHLSRVWQIIVTQIFFWKMRCQKLYTSCIYKFTKTNENVFDTFLFLQLNWDIAVPYRLWIMTTKKSFEQVNKDFLIHFLYSFSCCIF
jgi:hypothetical protein